MTSTDRHRNDTFYGLITRHKALIERLCMRRTSGDDRLCTELINECYVFIWKHQKQISAGITPLQESLWVYWLCRSAFSRLNFLHKAHLWEPLDESMAENIADVDCNDALRERIESMASVLTPGEREALKLMAEGYTPEEMALKLGIKHQSAIQLRYRIINKLRRHFK